MSNQVSLADCDWEPLMLLMTDATDRGMIVSIMLGGYGHYFKLSLNDGGHFTHITASDAKSFVQKVRDYHARGF